MEAVPAVNPTRKFYVFDRDDTLIDRNNGLINPQAIIPFVQGIQEEESFAWAIASAGALELQEDEGFRALQAATNNGLKPPVYVQFNRQATLLKSAVAIDNIEVEWNTRPADKQEGARTVFDILLNAQLEAEAPQPKAREEKEDDLFAGKLAGRPIKAQHDDTKVTFNKKSQITFQFGETTITFNLKKLLENIGEIAKGDYKLFFILQALDKAKFKPSKTHLDVFGVITVNTPADYVNIPAKDVVFLDDKESNCAVIAKAGFTAIVADTAVTLDKRENKTTDTYLAKLEETLPSSVRLKRLIASSQNVGWKSRPTAEIVAARDNALSFITQLLNEKEDRAILRELPQLDALFGFKEIRVFSKSVDPMKATDALVELANAYVEGNLYHKELSDFLILNLGHEWKRAEIQAIAKKVAGIKPEGEADISTTHFREAYEAQYNAEFFKNPFSSMHKEIARDPAAFDQKPIGEIKNNITDKNGRSNIVLRALGAK